MITNITHAGVLHVDDILKGTNNTILISILDYNARHRRPNFNNFSDVLSLCFKDRCEEDYGLQDNWPDEPDIVTNFNVLGVVNERLFGYSDAIKIVDFFEQYHTRQEEYNLIAHCKSGVGRSAAIAEFFGITHNIPYRGTDPQGRFMPNCRVTRLLTKAYFNKYKHADNGNNNTTVQQLGIPQRCYLGS
jgi:predicted protein tyrosine phosphatase